MGQELIEFVALVIFVLLLGGMLLIVVGAVIRRTRTARHRMQSQIKAHKISEGKFIARNIEEWITVGEYDIYVHQVVEQMDGLQRVIYAEVEYRNQSGQENLSCRRNQWHVYSKDGYSYEAESPMGKQQLYAQRPYFGGDRFINPGMNVRGWLAFKVPQVAHIIVLQFMTAFIGTRTADIHIEHRIKSTPVNTGENFTDPVAAQTAPVQKSAPPVTTQTTEGSFLSAVMQHFQYLLTEYGFHIKTVDLSKHPPELEEWVEFESPSTRVRIVNNQRSINVTIHRVQDDRYRYSLNLSRIREYHLLSEAAKTVTCSLDPRDDAEAEALHQAAISTHLQLPSETAFQYLDLQLVECSKWLREYAESFLKGDLAQWLDVYEYDVFSSRAAYIRSGKDEFVTTSSKDKDERRSMFQHEYDYLESLRKEQSSR